MCDIIHRNVTNRIFNKKCGPILLKFAGGAPNSPTLLRRYWAEVHHIITTYGRGIGV